MPVAQRPITIEDLWSLKRLGTGSVSPDGAWTCATVTSYSVEKNEASTQLWLLSTDGKTQRQLTRGKRDGDPHWSPDGQWIAFTATRGEGKDADEEPQLYLIAPDGGEARPSRAALGADAFSGYVVHLGALGVVLELELALVPAFDLRQDVYERLPWEATLADLDAVFADGYSVSLFTSWAAAGGDGVNDAPFFDQVWRKAQPAAVAPPMDGVEDEQDLIADRSLGRRCCS